MDLLLGLCPLVAHHKNALLLCVLVVNFCHDVPGASLISRQKLLDNAGVNVLQLHAVQLRHHIIVDGVLEVSEEVFVVVDFLLQDLGLPLPEGLDVVHLLVNLNSVAGHFLEFISHNFDHADIRLVALPHAHGLDSSVASGQLLEPGCDFQFDFLHRRVGAQVLPKVKIILQCQALRFVDQLLHMGSQLFSLGESSENALVGYELRAHGPDETLSVLGATTELTEAELVPHFVNTRM